jgi:hypothetical protein
VYRSQDGSGQRPQPSGKRPRLSPDDIAAVQTPTKDLLDALANDPKLVSPEAQHFLHAIQSSLVTAGWNTARVGYTACVTTRNALVALGRAFLKLNSLAGGLPGVALFVGDPNFEQTRLLMSFLHAHGGQILSFSAPFPELRVWLTWILDHLSREDRSVHDRVG